MIVWNPGVGWSSIFCARANKHIRLVSTLVCLLGLPAQATVGSYTNLENPTHTGEIIILADWHEFCPSVDKRQASALNHLLIQLRACGGLISLLLECNQDELSHWRQALICWPTEDLRRRCCMQLAREGGNWQGIHVASCDPRTQIDLALFAIARALANAHTPIPDGTYSTIVALRDRLSAFESEFPLSALPAECHSFTVDDYLRRLDQLEHLAPEHCRVARQFLESLTDRKNMALSLFAQFLIATRGHLQTANVWRQVLLRPVAHATNSFMLNAILRQTATSTWTVVLIGHEHAQAIVPQLEQAGCRIIQQSELISNIVISGGQIRELDAPTARWPHSRSPTRTGESP